MDLGPYLRQLREARGVSLRQLARELGIEPSYLSKVEHGDRKPSEEMLRALATALETNPDLLLLIAGKVTEEFIEAAKRYPEDFLLILKRMSTAPAQEVSNLTRVVRDGNW